MADAAAIRFGDALAAQDQSAAVKGRAVACVLCITLLLGLLSGAHNPLAPLFWELKTSILMG
jgi:hypothetical protein